jgi:hypothetical protein
VSEESERQDCEEYADDLAELALGILTGRARAATLAHVERCARCADELEHLSRVADAVVRVAPESEPPVGFEVRLFSRMGVSDTVTRRRLQQSRWLLAAAAAVVLLGIGVGVGWVTGSDAHSASPGPANIVAAGNLVEHGHTVGRVVMYGGSKPWMFVTLDDSTAQGHVWCAVVTKDGRTQTEGSFTASDGYGAWGEPLHIAPSQVRTAEVVSPSGTVIAATAPLA